MSAFSKDMDIFRINVDFTCHRLSLKLTEIRGFVSEVQVSLLKCLITSRKI